MFLETRVLFFFFAREWKVVAAACVLTGAILCYCTGIAGYMAFRSTTQGDILDNFSGPMAACFKVVVVLHLIMYIPGDVSVYISVGAMFRKEKGESREGRGRGRTIYITSHRGVEKRRSAHETVFFFRVEIDENVDPPPPLFHNASVRSTAGLRRRSCDSRRTQEYGRDPSCAASRWLARRPWGSCAQEQTYRSRAPRLVGSARVLFRTEDPIACTFCIRRRRLHEANGGGASRGFGEKQKCLFFGCTARTLCFPFSGGAAASRFLLAQLGRCGKSPSQTLRCSDFNPLSSRLGRALELCPPRVVVSSTNDGRITAKNKTPNQLQTATPPRKNRANPFLSTKKRHASAHRSSLLFCI